MGFIFLLLLFIPNIYWTKHKPKDYEKYGLHLPFSQCFVDWL